MCTVYEGKAFKHTALLLPGHVNAAFDSGMQKRSLKIAIKLFIANKRTKNLDNEETARCKG